MTLKKNLDDYHPLGPPPSQPRKTHFYPKIFVEDEEKSSKVHVVDSSKSIFYTKSELLITNKNLLEEYDACLTDTVSPGDVVIAARPFVFVPSTAIRGLRCEHCFVQKDIRNSFFHCLACNYAVYCSEACAEKDKEYHNDECVLFERVKRRPSSDTVRFVLRFLLKMKRNGGIEADIVPDGDSWIHRRFYDLIDHFDDILLSPSRRDMVENAYAEILTLMGTESAPDPNYFLEVYGRMAINSFHISDKATQDTIGSGLYLGPSIMNHSCVPTASVSFEGKDIVVRSLVPMEKKDFSKIFISYVDLMESKEHRRSHLERNYYFFCQCSRCLDEKLECPMFSIKCPNCHRSKNELISKGFVPLGKSPSKKSSFRCETCGDYSIQSEKIVTEYLEALEIVQDYLEQESIPLDVSKFCLKLMDMNDFHPLHICYIKTTECIFENCWEEWREGRRKAISSDSEIHLAENVVLYGRKLIQYYERYSLHIWNYEGIILAKLAVAENYLKKYEESKKHLERANEILYVTMGEVVSI